MERDPQLIQTDWIGEIEIGLGDDYEIPVVVGCSYGEEGLQVHNVEPEYELDYGAISRLEVLACEEWAKEA
jgi:hypothetical protein